MNSWQQHVLAWGSCQRCPLHKTRNQIVLCRGEIPSAIFFCGEAPGEAEDTFGVPFCGPAGHELDSWIAEATSGFSICDQCGALWGKCCPCESNTFVPIRMAYGNLLACIPKDANGAKVHEPEPDCVDACKPRLLELVAMIQPKLIVCVGKVSDSWTDPKYSSNILLKHPDGSLITRVAIDHPARYLRCKEPSQRRDIRSRSIVVMRTAIEQALMF